jgi:hypothetical protein
MILWLQVVDRAMLLLSELHEIRRTCSRYQEDARHALELSYIEAQKQWGDKMDEVKNALLVSKATGLHIIETESIEGLYLFLIDSLARCFIQPPLVVLSLPCVPASPLMCWVSHVCLQVHAFIAITFSCQRSITIGVANQWYRHEGRNVQMCFRGFAWGENMECPSVALVGQMIFNNAWYFILHEVYQEVCWMCKILNRCLYTYPITSKTVCCLICVPRSDEKL